MHYKHKELKAALQGRLKFLVYFVAPLSAIQGQIKSSNNGSVLAGVVVSVTDSMGNIFSAVSDSFGNYSVSGLVYGGYSISFSGAQMEPVTQKGTLTPGQVLTTNTFLRPAQIKLNIISPANSSTTYLTRITVTGSAINADTISVQSESSRALTIYPGILSGTYSYNVEIPLEEDQTTLTVSATNKYGESSTKTITVMRTPFALYNRGDSGSISVMESVGNYDAFVWGVQNDTPRQTIAKEYIRTHGDTFDFLVYLSTFDYALPEAGAEGFYLPVRNDVQGINQPVFDNSAQFGSASKLQGTIDLGNINALAAAPFGPLLDTNVRLLNHELMHRFGSYVRFKNADDSLNTNLLGKDNAHWSYLLDSKGSIMYGNGWRDNADGTFTATSARSGYSPLDLYLMGMIPKEQVPPMLLIDNANIDKTKLPNLGDSISGTARTITIDDIIAAEGERIPNAATAQKKFNVGFVLLTRAGDDTTAATQAIETLRKAWAGRLAEQTNGIGGIGGIAPSVSVVIDSPAEGATITGPDVTVTGTIINSSGAETGVTVNGMPATVTGNRFIVNHAPLQSGVNSLAITATDANGLTTTASRTITATTGNYIRISSNIESGTGPLDVTLRIDSSFVVVAPVVSISGPGGAATLSSISATEYTARFISEGTYTVTATATGPDGQSYTDSVTITVMSRYQLETLLKGKWEGMKQKIAAGDIEGAGTYFPQASREMFLSIFGDTNIDSAARLNDVSAVKVYTQSDNYAQGGLIRQDEDGEFSYPITFSRDESGLWHIYNF
jgi:hypothetical protein